MKHFERLEKKYKQNKIENLEITNNKLLISLHEELSQILNNNSKEKLEVFFANFEKLYPNFRDSIFKISSKLTTNELRLCALLRLNLTSKEISILLNITPESVNKARYRLRKKFNISPKEDLSNFIINI